VESTAHFVCRLNQMTRYRQDIGQGIHLSYLDRGRGQPLLLIHGFTGTAESNLGGVIAELQTDYRLIAPDLRGYGASRPPNRDFPPDFYQRDADDLAALLDALDCGPVFVLGYSDGAEAALLLAATRPDLVHGVVAWGVSGVISPEELAKVQTWLPVSAWGEDDEEWRQEIIRNQGEEQLEPLITGWVSAAQAIYRRGGNISYEESARITCPTLLLNGDQEVGNTVRDVTALAERIPDCRLVFIADSGHPIQRDQPASLYRHIRAFITGHAAPASWANSPTVQ
jgi:valacyclovir hydrolase